jgi:hypothetical protein
MISEITVEDDGDLCVDFIADSRVMLSVSVSPTGAVSYAMHFSDGRSAHGCTRVLPEVFAVLGEMVEAP